jgi:ATP synthase protein I
METPNENTNENNFSRRVAENEIRKLNALGQKKENPLLGLSMFGMVGWTVAVPALLGTALGIWLDKTYQQSFSWTLTCLIAGLITGCFIAWNWVIKEK